MNITTLFMDIGGVLLTNGWGRDARTAAIDKFGLEKEETEERHHLTFDTYEEGKITLDEYLNRVIFYKERSFDREQFRHFMFEQSQALPEDSLSFFKKLKKDNHLRVIAVSNEGRELNAYRIGKFKLNELFDAYISSCYVHMRKPDPYILQMALDVSHSEMQRSVYIDDRLMFVQVAQSFGLNAFQYTGLDSAKEHLAKLNLRF